METSTAVLLARAERCLRRLDVVLSGGREPCMAHGPAAKEAMMGYRVVRSTTDKLEQDLQQLAGDGVGITPTWTGGRDWVIVARSEDWADDAQQPGELPLAGMDLEQRRARLRAMVEADRDGAEWRAFIDGAGYWWREWSDGSFSMVPTNPDNSPIPEPRRYLALKGPRALLVYGPDLAAGDLLRIDGDAMRVRHVYQRDLRTGGGFEPVLELVLDTAGGDSLGPAEHRRVVVDGQSLSKLGRVGAEMTTAGGEWLGVYQPFDSAGRACCVCGTSWDTGPEPVNVCPTCEERRAPVGTRR